MLFRLLFACTFLLPLVLGSPVASPAAQIRTNSTVFASALAAVDTCTDISTCRTRYTIVWSSLATIFACVWTVIHRNVPAPDAGGSRLWRIVGKVWDAAKIVVVTFLVPEWVLAWAVRQFLAAREVGKKLEEARGEAEGRWTEKREKLKAVKPVLTEAAMVDDVSAAAISNEASPLLQAESDPQSPLSHARESVEKSKVSEELAFDGESTGK
ncbi:hypothetical protein BV25DRAFT_1918177 [Artomyces pyxidatus]|uniref:Uncharacterized protein n=1 Tax=Artomyces pyxidatus TaxID=48021 RepID=A0ACB8SUE4_9AGAM|nr:hypothetical protein BV25DRAFT_1918177 [Artomyces pyxidatus]